MLIESKLNENQKEDLCSLFMNGLDECWAKSIFEYEFEEFCSDNKLPFLRIEFDDSYNFFLNHIDNQK